MACKTQREGEKKQKTQHESERERTEKNNRRTQQPTSEIKCGIDQANERDRSQRARSSARAPIDPATQSSDRDRRFDLRAIAMRRSQSTHRAADRNAPIGEIAIARPLIAMRRPLRSRSRRSRSRLRLSGFDDFFLGFVCVLMNK